MNDENRNDSSQSSTDSEPDGGPKIGDEPSVDPSTDDTKSRLSTKDIITLTISIFALLVSSTTAFFSIVKQNNYISMFEQGSPITKVDLPRKTVSVKTDFVLTFLNLGARPATITASRFYIRENTYIDDDCHSKSHDELDIPISTPVIMKPGEISNIIIDKDFSLPLLSNLSDKKIFFMEYCVYVNVITPENEITFFSNRLHLTKHEVGSDGQFNTVHVYTEGANEYGKPIVVLRDWKTIFSR